MQANSPEVAPNTSTPQHNIRRLSQFYNQTYTSLLKNYLNRHRRLLISVVVSLMACGTYAQSISGYVRDENGNPIAYANIFVKETEGGASADEHGKYFLAIDPGIYNLVISSMGFQSLAVQVIVRDNPVLRNFTLYSSTVELEQIEIRARRRDPAYEIMQRAIDRRESSLSAVKSFRTQIYLRALEKVDVRSRQPPEELQELEEKGPPVDPVAEARKKEEARLSKINFVEMQLTLNYEYPDRYKEERTAFKSYGNKAGLFIPLFDQTDFNFYHNLVDLKGISEVPMISPLSRLAILSYRFKLEQILKEDSQTVYKIRVTPRKAGDATVKGFVFINDSTWNINRLDLTIHKGALKFYDDFNIRQSYKKIKEGLWIPYRQEFDYETKSGRRLFKGNTVLVYSDFQNDYDFPPRFFGNEVAVTSAEAYKRDSTYWNQARPVALEGDERKVVAYRDSIEAAHSSKTYLDSIEAAYNRITVGEVLYNGLGFRNDEKKSFIYFAPLIGLIDFSPIGGWRVGPDARYFRRFENERFIWTGAAVRMGLKNKDLQGNINFSTRYDPFRSGDVAVRFGREFYSINSFDAYLNQLKISNYIVRDHADFFHRIELFNGFYVSTDIGYSDRRSVEDYDATSIINEVIDPVDPLKFEEYQAVITNLRLAYTPGQKYMREPNRKVVLGSNYPTFLLNHKKGWNGAFGSDVDFDYVDFGIEQSLLLGTLGSSKYTISTGRFLNTRDLRYIDFKRFRQSDPYLYSDPMHSFQLLDTALASTDWYVEGHYIHYFNGAMINNIPLVKKLKLRTVAGAGAMWIREGNFRHEEIFGGIERIFKIGARRRLKIGLYGVLAESNYFPPQTDWKISFDIIDTWKRDWSY
jgi:hypothetical protein